jgi:hypothetical protein
MFQFSYYSLKNTHNTETKVSTISFLLATCLAPSEDDGGYSQLRAESLGLKERDSCKVQLRKEDFMYAAVTVIVRTRKLVKLL